MIDEFVKGVVFNALTILKNYYSDKIRTYVICICHETEH